MVQQTSETLAAVREELLGEALRSPGLLADLANLERYIAETYSARSFIELLQNADDAGASRFMVTRHGEWLICANDGRAFSRQDFYSLCRSASSAKQRGQTIGYRGIGFKSVVGLATSVHLLSGELRASFSRDLTQGCLGQHSPAPLVRIPHPLTLKTDDSVFQTIQSMEQSGFSSIFILGGLDAERVQDEFDLFDADYLLFLRHIKEATLAGNQARSYRCVRQVINTTTHEISISGLDRHSAWHIQHVGECDLAFSLIDGMPTALNAAAAIVHAFLPTLETTGFGIRINADFSTDPSRTRIIFDDSTISCIDNVAQAIADKISMEITSPEDDFSLLACLTPTIDLATLSLQRRSFRTELIGRVKNRLEYLKNKVVLAPNWLNTSDANKTADSLKDPVLVFAAKGDRQANFMRYLGVKNLSTELVVSVAKSEPLSPKGCAEVIAHCVKNVGNGVTLRQLIEKPVWHGTGLKAPTILSKLTSEKAALDRKIVESINTAGVSSAELARMLKTEGLRDDSICTLLPGVALTSPTNFLPSEPAPVVNISPSEPEHFDPLRPGFLGGTASPATQIITSRSLPAWRSAEQYALSALSEHGYQVEDRSRQNLGYDLYAENNGRKYYIEVKLVDYAGQPFVITTNEESVARECGDSYAIALVLRSSGESAHVRFFLDPVHSLKFVRQCRQWVWECSDYEFDSSVVSD